MVYPKKTRTEFDKIVDMGPGYFPTVSGTQEASVQQTPRPVDQSVASTLPIVDVSPGVSSNIADTQSYGIFLIESPVAGIGFGGFLPPGAMCLLTPLGRRSELVAMAAQHALGRDLASLATNGPTKPLSGANIPSTMPFGSVLLRAGEAVSFGRTVTGLCGVFFNAWETPILSQNSPGVNPPTYPAQGLGSGNGANYLFNDFGVVGPTFRPYLRLFAEPDAVPRQVAYTKVPKVTSFVPQSSAAAGSPWLFNVGGSGGTPLQVKNALSLTTGYAWALIPPGTKHVTLAFAATANNGPTLITGTSAPQILSLLAVGGTGFTGPTDVNLYWLMPDGVAHFHAGDQWTATARGQLSATHDLEVYDVPNCAVALMPYVVNAGVFTSSVNAGLPWATVICTED